LTAEVTAIGHSGNQGSYSVEYWYIADTNELLLLVDWSVSGTF